MSVLRRAAATLCFVASVACRNAAAQDVEHVPPDPPQQTMPAMSQDEMTQTMQMNDASQLWMFRLDEFERTKSDDAYATVWNAQAWYGGDIDKLWLRSEGDREHGATDARIEAFWDHAFASFWDWQIGARHDAGTGGTRDWLAFGVQGIAPYWFEVEATAYVGDASRSAARLRVSYEVLLTQRLILEPELELNFYSRGDRTREVAAGFSDAELGLRLRYEIRREIAPYVGVVRSYRHDTLGDVFSDINRARSETQLVVGLRLWF